MSPWTSGEPYLRPISRFTPKTVFSGLVIAWRLATCPTSLSLLTDTATIYGVVRPPSVFVITLASPPSITATQELVVPRSIPIIFAILLSSSPNLNFGYLEFAAFKFISFTFIRLRIFLIGGSCF